MTKLSSNGLWKLSCAQCIHYLPMRKISISSSTTLMIWTPSAPAGSSASWRHVHTRFWAARVWSRWAQTWTVLPRALEPILVGKDDVIWLPGHRHKLEIMLDFESVRLSHLRLIHTICANMEYVSTEKTSPKKDLISGTPSATIITLLLWRCMRGTVILDYGVSTNGNVKQHSPFIRPFHPDLTQTSWFERYYTINKLPQPTCFLQWRKPFRLRKYKI